MFIIYDLIFLIFAVIYLPVFLLRRKFHRGFWQRLGFLPSNLRLERPIWIHAVSVGEVMAMRVLADNLRESFPGRQLVISTVTPTGNKVAQGLLKEGDFLTYLPLDFSFIVRKAVERINPSVFIIAETEIWPNLISCLYQKNIPVIIVNGRISNRSFCRYLAVKFFFKGILNKVRFFCAQTELDAQRLHELGVAQEKIKVTGNMKFDASTRPDIRQGSLSINSDYKRKLNLETSEKLLVAASTHPGEEEIILAAYQELIKEFPQLRLLLAPRHPQRAQRIAGLIEKFGFQPLFISSLSRTLPCRQAGTNYEPCLAGRQARTTIFILDTIGELLAYYGIADIVFVGGSLVKKGGHNILEPASLNKPVLFGPQMFNFRDIADLFLNKKAAIMVRSAQELEISIAGLLNNPAQALALGRAAGQIVLENQGACRRNILLIKEIGCYETRASL